MSTPMTARHGGRLSLLSWTGLLAAGSALVVALEVLLTVRTGRRLSPAEAQCLVLGAVMGLSLAAVPLLAAARLARGLRALHAVALARLNDPPAELPPRPFATRSNIELAEVAQLLDALQLRIRVGDEASERHRRAAETAGLGVFKLLSGLVTAEEGARGQLAAELHDTVAQSLMLARGLLVVPPGGAIDLAALAEHVEDAEEHVRAVMARTRPPALREGDLAGAVDSLRIDMQARYGLRISIDWPAAAYPLPLASAITVYRFFQEALLNVVKHADVDDAALSLRVTADGVVATVRDAGPGFHPIQVRPRGGRHVGLGLLRERARLSGGSLEIMSTPVKGATLSLSLPRPPGLPAATLLPVTRQPAARVPAPRSPEPRDVVPGVLPWPVPRRGGVSRPAGKR